jgi:hypothetical protein
MVVRALVKRRDRPWPVDRVLRATQSRLIWSPSTTLHAVRSPVTLRGSARPARDHAERLPSLAGVQEGRPLARTSRLRGSKGVVPIANTQTKPPVTSAALAFPCERADLYGGFVLGTLAVAWPPVNRRSQPGCPPNVDNHVDSMCTWRRGVVERPGHTHSPPVYPVETCPQVVCRKSFGRRERSDHQPLRRAG